MMIKKLTLFGLLLTLPLAPLYSQTLNDSLKYYYPMNGNAKDASDNKNDCTVKNATLTSDRFGRSNNAYYFNGNAGLFAPFSMAGFKAMTITAWVKTSYTGQQATIIFFEGSTVMYTNRFSAGKVFTAFDGTSSDNSSSQESTTRIDDDKWVMVTSVNDGTTAYTYINDKQESFYSEDLVNKTGTMGIGQQLNNLWGFVGAIDDIRIYNRALTSDEVKEIYKINPTSVEDTKFDISDFINVYPNPANDLLYITIPNTGKTMLTITDLAGKICYSEEINAQSGNNKTIDISSYKSGLYIVNITTANFAKTQKISVK